MVRVFGTCPEVRRVTFAAADNVWFFVRLPPFFQPGLAKGKTRDGLNLV